MEKHIAVYVRVSSRQQDVRSQVPDLKRWIDEIAARPAVQRAWEPFA